MKMPRELNENRKCTADIFDSRIFTNLYKSLQIRAPDSTCPLNLFQGKDCMLDIFCFQCTITL